MPRVSVITATYNRCEVLRYAVESVRAQTFTDWEHIVIGDACSDGTDDLIRSYADRRPLFVNRPRNFGEQSRPNNDGLALAKGELIAFLNHDDLWFPDHLERLIQEMEATKADIVYAPLVAIDDVGEPQCGFTNGEMRYDPSHYIPASLWLVKREVCDELEGWRQARELHTSNPSQDFLVRAWRHGKKIVCAPTVTAILLPSGMRPNTYRDRDATQHSALFAAMRLPTFRDKLVTRMALAQARHIAAIEQELEGVRATRRKAVDRLLVAAKLDPVAVRNRIGGKEKGHWIKQMRMFRGLPPEASDKAQ